MNDPLRPKHPDARKCKSCGALVVWFITKTGKRMPVDEATTTRFDTEHSLDLSRHVSHFATCPNAAGHRRAR